MLRPKLISQFIRRNIKLTLIFAASAGVLAFFLVLLFPETGQMQAAQVYSNWPQVMKDLFGDPAAALSDVYGWLNLQVFHITFWVLYGVLGAMLAVRIAAQEIEEKTIDILLSLPLSRTEIMFGRLTATVALLAVSIPPVAAGCGLGIAVLGQPLKPGLLLAVSVNGLGLALVIASVTLLVSVFFPSQTSSIFISLGTLALMFLYTQVAVKLVPFLKGLAFLSPFHYYSPERILIHQSVSLGNTLILMALAAALSLVAVKVFERRDILF